MIERYRLEAMAELFEDEAKFSAFLDVELATLKAFSNMGIIPKNDVDKIVKHARFDVARIKEIEQVTRHDVIAFTRSVSESLGEEKKWVHYGLTSTDVVDTAMGIIYKQANAMIEAKLENFLEILKVQALRYEKTPMIGRTHGIHADVTVFGLKFALWYDMLNRQTARFKEVRKGLEQGKISGAVGNFANVDPSVQDDVCLELGLYSSRISTQVLARDHHADYLHTLSMIASVIETIALEIRHLQRTEVGEASEAFSTGQKGSSAMPHKRNPIASENMAGCARMMRGYASSAKENIMLWHERDISHSSFERVMLPDAMMLLDYMLDRYGRVLSNIVVNETRMLENIQATYGVIFAQRVLHKLIDTGLAREEAYDLIQPVTFEAYESKVPFKHLCENHSVIGKKLSQEALNDAFSLDYYFKHVNAIYKRVGIV